MFLNTDYCRIWFEKNDFVDLKEFIHSRARYSHLFIITDLNTGKYCLPLLKPCLGFGIPETHISIPPGEENKTLETTYGIWQRFYDEKAGRDSLVINLGGGLVSDIGGFAASTYNRGVDFINIPTSLIGQIDAAFGGKTGVDFRGMKNVIGTFAHPKAVIINESFLATLPENQKKSGYAEALKHALIDNRGYWEYLREFKFETFTRLIFKSLEIKKMLVESDPRDKGVRRKLNFGHTIGHALESLHLVKQETPIAHGLAVAAGILCEAHLSKKVVGLSVSDFQEIQKVITTHFKKIPVTSSDMPYLLEFITRDKKNLGKRPHFTLIEDIGEAVINQDVDDSDILESLEYYQNI